MGIATERKDLSRARILKLFHGLGAVLESKGIERITVQDIVGEAGVHRATFYRHVENIQDLCHRGMDIFWDDLIQEMELTYKGNPTEGKEVPLHISFFFQSIWKNRHVLRPFLSPKGPAFFRQNLLARLRTYIESERINSGISSEKTQIQVNLVSACLLASIDLVLQGISLELCEREYCQFVFKGLGLQSQVSSS